MSSNQATYTGYVSVSNAIQLPSDCRAVQSLPGERWRHLSRTEAAPRPKRWRTPLPPAGSGMAQGRVLQLIGGADQPDFALSYYQAIPAGGFAATGELADPARAGLYLYASLLETSPYIQDDSRALVGRSNTRDILERMQVEDNGQRYGNAPMQRITGP